MLVVNGIRGEIEQPVGEIFELAARRAGLSGKSAQGAFVYRRAIDARRRVPVFVYSVGFDGTDVGDGTDIMYIKEYKLAPPSPRAKKRPVIVGLGPAGMFCALALARMGLEPTVIERGGDIEARDVKVRRFFETGVLDPDTNVQFGAGGAGTYSDGKLTTRIRDPRCRWVLERLAEFGASGQVLWQALPHIGTDCLGGIVSNIVADIRAHGGRVLFDTRMTDIEVSDGRVTGVCAGGEVIPADTAVLACGHSARDVYAMLAEKGVTMTAKPFSAGLRIEHLQRDVDSAMYGDYAGHPALGSASYSFSHRRGERGVYTFCMCPGGRVVAAASEPDGAVCNGMSAFARDGRNANSALCVSVLPSDFGSGALAGLEFQRRIERAVYAAAGAGRLPGQRAGDFLEASGRLSAWGRVEPDCTVGVVPGDLRALLPGFVSEYIGLGLSSFAAQASFFGDPDAVLTGVETRTSSPVRVLRDESGMSPSLYGLYPVGEGAGYSGGIVSSAVDGLCAAERIGAAEE